MTVGLSATNLANGWINTIRGNSNGSNFTAPAVLAVKLHTGDPGSAGTSNASSVTTRNAIGLAAASAGSTSLSATVSWTSWAGTNGEVVSHISVWDSTTAGNFLFSVALTASKTVNTGDTLTLSTLTFALTPIAA